VEVEVSSAEDVEEALRAGAGALILSGFAVEDARAAVARVNGRVPVEVAGAITLQNVREYAEAGPDFIAVGALTHSAPAADLSLEVEI
jgi:nicotinate-nucleotide pyrophosphorylase (carboxylating)